MPCTAVLGWKGVVTEKENPINSFMEVLIRVTFMLTGVSRVWLYWT